jgi:hypothetical protein
MGKLSLQTAAREAGSRCDHTDCDLALRQSKWRISARTRSEQATSCFTAAWSNESSHFASADPTGVLAVTLSSVAAGHLTYVKMQRREFWAGLS